MIYKIRVILETEEDVFRDIEVKPNQTLWNLYEGIKSAFGLKDDQLASFYVSDENWSQLDEIPLEDMSEDGEESNTMSDVYIKDAYKKVGDRLLFVYDFMKMWSFYTELQEIKNKKPIGLYPLTVFRFGKMPLKGPDKKFLYSSDGEFDKQDNNLDLIRHLKDEDRNNYNFEQDSVDYDCCDSDQDDFIGQSYDDRDDC